MTIAKRTTIVHDNRFDEIVMNVWKRNKYDVIYFVN